jgi:glutaredoxin
MALSGTRCPDCHRTVRVAFEQTITGRRVCPDCANALRTGSIVRAVSDSVQGGIGVWGMMMRRIRRTEE